MTAQQLREKRAELLGKRKALDDKLNAESRDPTPDEQTQFDAWGKEADALKAKIAERERVEQELANEQDELTTAVNGVTPGLGTPDASATALNRIGNPRPNVLDDPRRGFASLGEYAAAVHLSGTPGGRDHESVRRLLATGMNQSTGSEGGFLVPPQFSTEIWDGMRSDSDNLLTATDNYTITGESLTMNASAETSRATGSRWGGTRGYWISEASQITSSKPTFRQMKLEPQQLAVLVYCTDKLLRNAPALNQYLARSAADEINFLVGDSIINGDGAGKPKGILNGTAAAGTSCRVTVAKENNQDAASLDAKNIAKMWARMHKNWRSGAVWYVSQELDELLPQLNFSIGTGGALVYLPPGGLTGQPNATLFGRPVVPLEYCAAKGTEGDIILANLKAYATGTKGGIDSAMSMHLRFDYAESVFRFMFEVDGQPWLASPITPYKATAGQTLSPFVTLATRS